MSELHKILAQGMTLPTLESIKEDIRLTILGLPTMDASYNLYVPNNTEMPYEQPKIYLKPLPKCPPHKQGHRYYKMAEERRAKRIERLKRLHKDVDITCEREDPKMREQDLEELRGRRAIMVRWLDELGALVQEIQGVTVDVNNNGSSERKKHVTVHREVKEMDMSVEITLVKTLRCR